jgi:hypothetical protein
MLATTTFNPARWALLGTVAHLFCHVYEPRTALQGVALIVLVPAILMSDNVGAALQSYCVFICSLSLSIILYRLSPIHPLYHVPGPILWKITKLTGILVSFTGHQHLYFKRAHDKYGPVIRTGN